MIGNKTVDKITKVSKTSPHNNLEAVTNKHEKELPNERYISSEERQKNVVDLTFILYYNKRI